MKVLFNCSINVVGGGVQNAYNFIIHAIQDKSIEWIFLVSPQVNELLLKEMIKDDRIIVIGKSPSRNIESRKQILFHEKIFNPDIVYTMAGPAYVMFKNFHVMGISNAYVTHANLRTYFWARDLISSIRMIIRFIYRFRHVKNANFFFFQTKNARDSFCKRYKISNKRTTIIPNAIGVIYEEQREYLNNNLGYFFNIFCPAAAYVHKNLHIIPQIAKIINSTNEELNFKFTLTLPSNSSIWKKIEKKANDFNVKESILNIGPYDYMDSPMLFSKADIVFIPSILETFSTSYLEAIRAKKPLLVVDLPFATEVCEDKAIYCKPFSIEDASSKLINIMKNYDYYLKESQNKSSNMGSFNQKNRYQLITNTFRSLI